MSEYSINEIYSMDDDWGLDVSTGLPYSKGAVQRFIKQMISQQISQMSEKIGWLQFEGTRIGFYDAPDGIKLGAVELSGIVYTINYTSDTNTNFFVLVSDEHKYITITPFSESGTIGGKMNEFIEDYEYTFSVDNGSGSYKQFKAGDCMNGESFKEDIRNYLTVGNNRIRVIITGKESTQSRSIIFIVTLTNLQLTCNMSWWKPFINGENYYIDKIFFGGNLNKTLNIKIDDDESQLYSINFTSSTNYLSSEYSYNMTNKFPKGGTGVHKVDVWMTGEGVETSHYKFNIMCIDTPDINNKSLVCINEIKDKAVNFDNQTLFKYATYNAISVNFDITCNDNGNNIVVIENQTIKVQTQTRNSYDIGFEINTESKENVSVTVNVSVPDFSQQFTLPLDNTNSYAAVDNPTFYLNCTNRSNGSLNRTEFINSSNVTGAVSSYSANFTGFAWSTDGWATDNDGNKCLVVNAGSYVEVPDFKPLSSAAVYNKTIEFKFRCSNVADYDTPVMSFMDTETYDPLRTNGIILFPTKILVLSTSNRQVTPQSVNLNEDSITHVTIVLQRNYANKGKNLCRIYINSYQNAVFEYSGNASFGDGYLKMGQKSADFYLYMMRLYDNRVLEENDVLGNFLNVLIDDKEFTRGGVRKDNNILDSGEINYDMCKKAGYNIMTIETDNDLPIPSIEYTSTVNSTLTIEYNDHPEWNFTITKAPLGGQGTTSMKYYRWNLRWKLKDKSIWTYADNSTTSKSGWFDGKDNHPKMNKITAKKNYASSMQGHKMGACKLYDELYYRLGFKTALPSETCRVAVFQYPVMGFQKFSDGSYSFIGLYTIGPDKGDSKTFGYDGDKYPNFLSLEGPNHNPLGTRFLHPWTENTQYDPNDETLKFGGQEGWDVDACPYETDVAEDRLKIQTLLENEWKPAYDIVYYCSPYLISLSEAGFASISQLNSNLNTFRNGMTIMSNRKNEVFQLYDSSYNLIHYDNTAGCYITLPHNILSYLTGYLMNLNPSTEELIQARKQKFYIESENYWSIPVALYRSCFLDLIGGSDNHAKNSYPFKFKSLSEGGRWCWRDDDLDTVLATDNNGQSTKPYGIEVGDITSDGTDIFQGSSSVFWTLIDDVFKNEKSSTMKKVISVLCEMAADVKLSSAYMHDTVYNIIGSYFWGNSSEYFPSLSYNKDATWCYITPWNIDPNKSYNNVYPLTQALGTQKDAEELWLYRRIIYIMSKYEIGGFTGSQHDGFNAIEFTPARSFTFNITPSQDMYPSANKGGGENINGGRTKAGEVCQILADSDGSTTFYLKGMDLYTDIGDLSGLVLTTRGGDTSTGAGFSVIGNKLRSIKIGDEDPSKVSFNASRFNISGKSLEYIDARNVTTLVSDVLLFDCPRLKKVYFQGTNASTIYLPMGAKITEIGYPTGIKTLFLHSLPMLDDEGILISDESINSLTGLYYYNCPNISPFDLLRKIYNQGQNLHFVTLIWDDVIEGTAADLDMFAEFTNPYNPTTNTGYGCIEFNPDTNQISNSTLRADFQGTININGYTYKDSFDALKNYFGNQLQISCLGYYIRFKDNVLLQLLLNNNYGDGIGITYEKAESITTSFNVTLFKWNTDITSFNELKEFKNITYINGESFYRCSSLKSIDLSNITDIGYNCFDSCTSLASVGDLSKMTRIKRYIFANCKSLTNITGLGNVTLIENGAFQYCSSLKLIDDLSNVTEIWSSAFRYTNIERLNLTNKLTVLGERVFEGCKSLVSVGDLSSATSIGGSAFCDCTSLINIGDLSSVTSINGSAFNSCYSLVSVGDLSNLITISPSVFYNCTSLVSVGDLSSVTSIGGSAFKYCSIERLNLTNKLTTIGPEAFNGCKSLVSVGDLSGVTSIGGSAFNGCTSLVSVGDLSGVTSIGGSAFNGCTSLVSVGDLSSLTSIGANVFNGCKSLVSVGDLSSLTSIGANVFNGCKSLVSVGDLSNVTEIWSSAFRNCKIERLNLTNKLTTIGPEAFSNCSYIINIGDLSSVTSIGGNAFNNCTSLISIESLSNAIRIGQYAFNDCTSLVSVGDLSNVTNIENNVFDGCTSLVSVGDLSNVTNIGGYAFRNCKIENINLTNKLTEIGTQAFTGCTSLVSVGDLSGVTSIGESAFYGCTSLVSVGDLSSAITIRVNTFNRCTSLVSVGDLSSTTSIGQNAFYGCTSLTKLDFSVLESIGTQTFYNTGLTTLIIRTNTVCTISTAYGGTTFMRNCILYVPDNLVDSYKTTEGWSAYPDNIKPLSEYVQ